MTKKPVSLTLLPQQQHHQLMLTKLDIPHFHDGLIPRERVMGFFDRAIKPGCTMVTAPAGAGKTLAVAGWVQSRQMSTAWLTLDKLDNEPLRFWTYLLASLDRQIPGIEKRLSPKVNSGSFQDPENFVVSLINEVATHKQPITLVLDDIHLIKQDKVIERLNLTMNHLGNHIRLILVGRGEINRGNDPFDTLPHLNRIGMDTLCFDCYEIESFMKINGVQLTSDQLRAVETMTEGWAVGLTLMQRALEEKRSPGDNLDTFNQKNEQLYHYLAQEVYATWPQDIQNFLLKTAILNRMTPALCNAVTGRADSRKVLRQLSKDRTFVICLNHLKGWYRYHNMLTSFLRHRLYEERRKEVHHLHRLAAQYYETNEIHHEAIEHYLKARHYKKAAALMIKAAPEMLRGGRQSHTLHRWLRSLPEKLIEGQYPLLLAKGWIELLEGRNKNAEKIIKQAEKINLLKKSGSVYSHWPEEGITETLLLEANLAKAEKRYEEAAALMAQIVKTDNYQTIFPEVSQALFVGEAESSLLASVHGFQGRISLFQREEEWLPMGMTHFFGDPGGGLKILMAEIFYERNELDPAATLLMEGMNEAETMEIWGVYLPAAFLLTKIMTVQGNLTGAQQTASQAAEKVKLYQQPLELFKALETRLYLLAGNLDKPRKWMEQCHLTICTSPRACQLYEQITRLRILMAQKKYSEASLGLMRLEDYAKKNQCLMNLVEIQTLHAIALYYDGKQEEAMQALEVALCLGQKEGYQRLFMDEGPQLLPLLKAYRRRCKKDPASSPISLDFMEEIIRGTHQFTKNLPPAHSVSDQTESKHQLVEALTPKEAIVLHCLSQKMTNQEIADHLEIKLATVKVHTRNIYSKLYVTNRTQAVNAARELGIL